MDCRDCLFFDNCETYYRDCDAFSPIIEEDNIEELIEGGRIEFRREWYEYMWEAD